jgi:sugar O-acyltransferase (sialic acid O-acetyltransferase NeuD family)
MGGSLSSQSGGGPPTSSSGGGPAASPDAPQQRRRTPLAVVGCGGHASCVIDCVELQGEYEVAALVDDFKAPGSRVCGGYPVLGPCDADTIRRLREAGVESFVIAVGDNATRAELAGKLRALWPSAAAVTLVHPSAFVARSASLGEGTVVLPGAVVQVNCRVGSHCIVNTRASLDHDGVMGDFSALAPGATVSGAVRIGAFSWVAAGAVVAHGRVIGANTVVGAGAVVVRDIPDLVVAFGVPAMPVRARQATDKYL